MLVCSSPTSEEDLTLDKTGSLEKDPKLLMLGTAAVCLPYSQLLLSKKKGPWCSLGLDGRS
jgi:hypothetical protein